MGVGDAALAVALAIAFVLLVALGLVVLDRAWDHTRSIWYRLAWLVPTLSLVLAGYVIVVELRCTLGWIDESECRAWDEQ